MAGEWRIRKWNSCSEFSVVSVARKTNDGLVGFADLMEFADDWLTGTPHPTAFIALKSREKASVSCFFSAAPLRFS